MNVLFAYEGEQVGAARFAVHARLRRAVAVVPPARQDDDRPLMNPGLRCAPAGSLVDGVDVREWNLQRCAAARGGWCPQEVFLSSWHGRGHLRRRNGGVDRPGDRARARGRERGALRGRRFRRGSRELAASAASISPLGASSWLPSPAPFIYNPRVLALDRRPPSIDPEEPDALVRIVSRDAMDRTILVIAHRCPRSSGGSYLVLPRRRDTGWACAHASCSRRAGSTRGCTSCSFGLGRHESFSRGGVSLVGDPEGHVRRTSDRGPFWLIRARPRVGAGS